MALVSGSRIGPYEILAPLGSGGMGDVYKARDGRLGRLVAIKVLSRFLPSDPERRKRFEQEARAASAVEHPAIVTVYDIAEVDGIPMIIMQFVEGRTLREILAAGALDLERSLDYAIQIADGLSEAHARGIVHRDLKPDNVMVTNDGGIRILDFGLAKLMEPLEGTEAPTRDFEEPRTLEGHVMGTAPYMSPEQAEGKQVDARTDIFSFGSLLYEMVSGRRAFDAPSVPETLAAVIRHEPRRVSEVSPAVPSEFERVLARTLRKDPERRFQSMSDVRVELQDIRESLDARTRRRGLPIAWRLFAFFASAVAVATALYLSRWRAPEPPLRVVPVTSLQGYELDPALSPDGRQVAFVWDGGERSGAPDLYVKLLSGGEPLRLTHGGGVRSPAWAPDATQIAFLRERQDAPGFDVLSVSALGGPEKRIAETASGYTGLDWSPDGELLAFSDRASDGSAAAIFVLSMRTGEKRQLTFPPTEGKPFDDAEPAFSPDRKSVAFLRYLRMSGGRNSVMVQAFGGGEPTLLTGLNYPVLDIDWTAGGSSLLFSVGLFGGTSYLMEVRAGKEPERLFVGDRARGLSVAANRLVYSQHLDDPNIWRAPGPASRERGAARKWCSSTRDDWGPHYSPDGTEVAFVSDRGGTWEIWVCDGDGRRARQLTQMGHAVWPRFSPDSQRLSFSSVTPGGNSRIYVAEASGGFPIDLTATEDYEAIPSWSRDGRSIYFQSRREGADWSIWKKSLDGSTPQRIVEGEALRPLTEDDESVFFWRGGSLFRLFEGREEELTPGRRVFVSGWDLWRGQLVYVDRSPPDRAVIEILDVTTRGKREIFSFEHVTEPEGLAVSPDGQWILYGQKDIAGSDLVLVENFR